MKHFLIFGLLLSLSCAAIAQQPAPSPEMKKLEPFSGDWVGKAKNYMEPGQPPVVTDATLKIEMIMGGMYQKIQYGSEMPGAGKIDGMIMTGYDAEKKAYRSWNFNNFIAIPVEEAAKWEGDVLVGKSLPVAMEGASMIEHTRIWTKGKDELFVKIEGEMGGQRFTTLELELKRKSASAVR